jgi:hypothetical protein
MIGALAVLALAAAPTLQPEPFAPLPQPVVETIVWADAMARTFRVGPAGSFGVPTPAPLPTPAFPGTSPTVCTIARRGLRDAGGWYCPLDVQNGTPPVWTGSPPNERCDDEMRARLNGAMLNGYGCLSSLSGIPNADGAWMPKTWGQ